MSPTTIPTVLEQLWTPQDLRIELAKYRKGPVPASTLRYWRNQLGIVANEQKLYEQADRDLLVALVLWMGRGGTIDQFVACQLKEVSDHAPGHERGQGSPPPPSPSPAP